MAVQGSIKLGFLFLASLVFFGFFSSKPKEAPLIQRAVVVENNAIVYKEPDFDAEQLTHLNINTIVAVSTQIYRPKNLFGSFYRIFLNRPHKIRGYISEIDVVPQYQKTEDGLIRNPLYRKKEKALKSVQKSGGIVSIRPGAQSFSSEASSTKESPAPKKTNGKKLKKGNTNKEKSASAPEKKNSEKNNTDTETSVQSSNKKKPQSSSEIQRKKPAKKSIVKPEAKPASKKETQKTESSEKTSQEKKQ